MRPIRCLFGRHEWERWHGFSPDGDLVSCRRRCRRCPAIEVETL